MVKMKSILYARVSTEELEQNNSYVQQKLYKDDRFEILKIFSDKASGSSVEGRENFLEMLNYVGISKDVNNYCIEHRTDIECIIVANVSRFSRNVVDARLIIDALHKNNVKVFFVDLNKFSDDADIFLQLNMYLMIEEQYLRDVSKKVKAGMQRKINTGYVLGSNKIWGYNYIVKDDGNGYLVAHPTESLMVKNIFKEYINGLGTRVLAKKYKLSQSTILGMLKNVKYKGYMGYNLKSDNPTYVKSQFVEPLISEEAFEEVQRIIKGRCNSENGKGRRIEVRSLTGKIKCSCGATYHYKGRGTQWCCGRTEGIGNRTKGCGSKQFHTKMIIPWLEKNIDNIESNLEFNLNREIKDVNIGSFERLKQRKEELIQQQDRLMDLYLNPTDSISRDVLERNSKKVNEELSEVENKIVILNDMNSHLNNLRRIKVEYKNHIKNIRKLIKYKSIEEIEKLISKIELETIINIINFKEELNIKTIQFSCFEELYNTNFVFVDETL
ncbi:recombinase family protein [Clostridium perfringens]|uniref:recombinase family protein n=1 Tax=Clostridium perfringens TaxID=1502 RepID=UPI001241BE78|nr:recombinase family protein [Clostridium perfringens]MDK0684971.1 recombinase family protein [Clostridium perfringens]MDM0493304.1 recombinase family protein [Clostridium perfringens]NGT31677.1 recombinase family protein [Clostridium perfringens]NGU09397.1 recombinase family protein [Clostridium perfringens]